MKIVYCFTLVLCWIVSGVDAHSKSIPDVMTNVCSDEYAHMVAFVPGSLTPIELGVARAGNDIFWDTAQFESLCTKHEKIAIAHCPAKGDPLPLIARPPGVSLQTSHFAILTEMLYRNAYVNSGMDEHDTKIYHMLYNPRNDSVLEFGFTEIIVQALNNDFRTAIKKGVFKKITVGSMDGENGKQVRYVTFPRWFTMIVQRADYYYLSITEALVTIIFGNGIGLEDVNVHDMRVTQRLFDHLLLLENDTLYFTSSYGHGASYRYELIDRK